MKHLRRHTQIVLAALSVAAVANSLRAQDSLRILRVQPTSPASPASALVIAFDHPVAPKLDESIRPERVLRITPAVPAHLFWRDPSTIVAEFDAPWAAGASYDVHVDPKLRSTSRAPLARTAPIHIRIEMPRLLLLAATAAGDAPDTSVRPVAVYTGGFGMAALAGHAWFKPTSGCVRSDSLPLTPVRVRPIVATDPYPLREAGGYRRDHRLDSARRVVELQVPGVVARGCRGELHVSEVMGESGVTRTQFQVRPAFAIDSVMCVPDDCERGKIALRFTNPVSSAEVRAHVTVNGNFAHYQADFAATTVVLLDSVKSKDRLTIVADAELRNTVGERLGHGARFNLIGRPASPAVGFATGVVVVPRDAATLLRVRHINVDTVVVIIARAAASKRVAAMSVPAASSSSYYGNSSWQALVRDTLALVIPTLAPRDSERILDVTLSMIPAEWRDEPLLLVRARPVVHENRVYIMGDSIRIIPIPPMGRPLPQFAVVARTNLAAHALVLAGAADLWVTSVRDAEARSGLPVTLWDDSLRIAQGVTDSLGRARLRISGPARSRTDQLHFEVADGSDRALLPIPSFAIADEDVLSDDTPAYQWWRAGNPSRIGSRWLHGTAFTDRGIYRPGENVFLSGAIRTFSVNEGYRVPEADSARWVIWYRQGYGPMERVWSHAGTLSSFGTLIDSFPIARTARLGTYVVTLALHGAGDWRTAGTAAFRIEEYRAPEFVAHVTTGTAAVVFGGDTASVTVSARYLFGLPMTGGEVAWWTRTSEREPWEMTVPGLEQFTVGRASWRLAREKQQEEQSAVGTGVIGADGTLRLRIPAPIMQRPGTLVIGTIVTDKNRQNVATELSLPVLSASVYVGMRMRERRWSWNPGDSIRVELVAADPGGTRLVGETISVVAQRSRWLNGTWVKDTVWSTTAMSTSTEAIVSFVPDASGDYEIIGTAIDERGRHSSTGLDIWVTGWASWFNTPDPRALTMRADKPRYFAGDTATVIIESPADQRAWITVQHEGLASEQMSGLRAGINVLRIPIPGDAGRDVTIRALAVRPYGPAVGNDSAGIYYRAGSLTLSLDSTRRSLSVQVRTDRARYQPRDSVHVTVDVNDFAAHGHASELTVWAVDEGVLSLTAYTRPDVLAMLLAGLSSNPWTSSTLLAWMRALPPATSPLRVTEGDQGSGNISLRGASAAMQLNSNVVAESPPPGGFPVRSVFRTTPFFAGNIRTDNAGHVTTSFTLPDNVTTYRIYAAAIGRGLIAGSGDTSIISTRPLVVRAALPRVVRVGDALTAGAVLTKESNGTLPVSLSVESRNVTIAGSRRVRGSLVGQRATELRFPMRVTGGDSVSFTFRGSTSAAPMLSDAVEARLAISPPGRARAYVATGMIEHAGDATLPVTPGTDTERSHVTLQLGVSVLPLIKQFSEALRIYPYFCTEQISSAGRTLLARLRLERASGDTSAISARDHTQLETAVATLVTRQRDDGGFGYWSNTGWTSPWLTAYALEFLNGARSAGIVVADGTIKNAENYITGTRDNHLQLRTWRDSLSWPHDALAAASLLRRIGLPDTVLEGRVRGMLSRLGFEDRLLFASLRASAGDSVQARSLLSDAWKTARLEGRRVVLDDSAATSTWLFRSISRPLTLLLTTTAQIEPRHPLLGALFESLVQTGRSERARWWNTLDQAGVAEALAAASPIMGLSERREIAVDGPRGHIAQSTLDHGRADSLSLSMGSVLVKRHDSIAVSLTSSSSARTYYAMTFFEVPLARPVRADEAGIGVERWYENYNTGKPVISVQEGDLVRVRLRITAPADREFVVIDDALPAGLEAVDLSLRTSSTLPPFAGAPKLQADQQEGPPGQKWLYGAWDGGWWTPWEHKEIRDDRVLYFARQLWKGSYQASYIARATTAGVFVRPPAQAEEMYNPAVRGRSDGGMFTVTRKK